MRSAPQLPIGLRVNSKRPVPAEAATRPNRLRRLRGVTAVFLIIGVLNLPPMAHPAAAQDGFQPASSQLRLWLNGPTATGDWGGSRDTLRAGQGDGLALMLCYGQDRGTGLL